MTGIEKLVTNGVQVVSSAVQKSGVDTQKVVQTIPLKKLDGLNALANQKMSFVQNASKPISTEEQKIIELLQEIIRKRVRIDKITVPPDDIMHFVVRNFINPKAYTNSEIRQLTIVIAKFQEMSTEQVDKILNSEFISILMNSPNATKGFKYSCLNISGDKLDLFESLSKNPLTKAFSESYFAKRNGDFENFDELIKEFQTSVELVSDFSKLDKSSIFYDLLCKRNSDDISELIQILQKRITKADDKQITELHSLLKTLLETKTPDGKFIFGSSEIGDKSSKTMMSGIENIINSKNNNLKQYEILMNLLDLTKEGKIPPSVLGTLAEKGKISSEFIVEIQKMQKGINSILQFTTKQSAIENSKIGEVVQIGAELFYRNQDSLSKINLDPYKFNELFPKIETMALSQGKLGDCYLVSAIHDFMKNNKGREKIFEMFSMDGNDIIVTIPDAKEFPIRFVNGIVQKDGDKNINAPKGIQMLEDAYRQTRALKYGTSNKMTSIEGGEQMNVYNAFLGNINAKSYLIKSDATSIPSKTEIENNIKEIGEDIKELQSKIRYIKDSEYTHFDYILDQCNIERLEELEAYQRGMYELLEQINGYKIIEDDKLIEKLLEFSSDPNCIISIGTKHQGDWLDKSKLIHSQHAYSIKSIDKLQKTINVVNPWNTAQYVTLSFDEFEKYFNTINVAYIN